MNAARQFACAAILALLTLPAQPQNGLAQDSAAQDDLGQDGTAQDGSALDDTAQDGSALESGTQDAPDGLCPTEPIWGLPPADDAIHVQPPLPAYDGWCRYLPPNQYYAIATALGGHVALDTRGNIVEVFDGTTGHSKWSARVGGVERHMGWDHLFAETVYGADLVALRLTDGEVDWTAEGCTPVGISSRAVWAAYRNFTLPDNSTPRALLQLDQKTGHFIKVNPLEDHRGFSSYNSEGGVSMQSLMKNRLLVTGSPMTEEYYIDLPGAGEWDGAYAGMSRTQHFVLQYRTGGHEAEGEILETRLSCYGFLGEFEWSREQTISTGLLPNELSCSGGIVLASANNFRGWGSLLFSAEDGSFQQLLPVSMPQVVVAQEEEDDKLYVIERGQSEQLPRLCVLDSESFELKPVFETTELIPESYVANQDMLYIFHANYHAPPLQLSNALYGLPLEEGKPRAGQLRQVNFPGDNSTLAAEFAARKEPLNDEQLMSSIVHSGLTVFASLLDAEDGSSVARLDALAALACYCERFAEEDYSWPVPSGLFTSRIRELAAPELIEPISRWLDDDSLQPLHHSLLGILALCGDEAAAALEAQYARRYPVEYAPPRAPYQRITKEMAAQYFIEKHPGYRHEDQQEGAAEAAAAYMEASVTAADGTVYKLFNNPGLQCLFDLYIAVDKGGDGSLDEVLPTGLLGISPPFNGTTIVSETLKGVEPPPAPLPGVVQELELGFDGQSFTIGSVWPVYGFPEWPEEYFDPAPDAEQELTIVSYEWRAVKLTLSELRRDSDADGLSDIAEGLLLTDPANADSDADGLSDQLDHSPLVDSAKMSREERGAARAIAYLFDNYPPFPREAKLQKLPVQARYVWVNGLGPVAFSTAQGTKSICPHELAKREAFLGLGGEGLYSSFFRMTWKPPGTMPDYDPNNFDIAAQEAEARLTDRSLEEELRLYFSLQDEHFYTLDFSQGGNWLTVLLGDVNGELYPISFSGQYGLSYAMHNLL